MAEHPGDRAVHELEEVTDALAELHRELVVIEQAQARERMRVLTQDEHPNITTAKANADVATLDFTVDVIRVKGEIAALRERKDFLRDLLSYIQSE